MVFKDRPTIGVFAKELPDIYFFPLLKGIHNTCCRLKVNLRFFIGGLTFRFFQLDDNLVFDLANKHNCDGILFLSVPMPIFEEKEDLETFINRFAPLPRVNIGIAIDNVPSIIVENKKGIYDVTSHFIEKHGFKNIAYIGGPHYNPEAALRFKGYKQALADHNIPFDPRYYYEGKFESVSAIEAAGEFFEKRKLNMDAIVAANDGMIMGVYEYCKKRGIKIPGDIAVSGFDNVIDTNYITPSLTTVAQPLYKAGMTGIKMICDLIENKSVPDLTILPTTLLLRRSCGCDYVKEINHGICEDPGKISALRGQEKEEIEKIRQKSDHTIREAAIIEKLENIQHLGDYIVSMISGKNNAALYAGFIEEIISSEYLSEHELNSWLDYLALFYAGIKTLSSFEKIRERTENTFSTLVHHVNQAIRFKMGSKRALIYDNTFHHRQLLYQLNLCFNLPDLLNFITETLVNQGFQFFYICLWDGNESGIPVTEKRPDNLRLMAGFDGREKINGYKKRIVFPTEELLPKKYFDFPENHLCLVCPLVQHDYSFGHIILGYHEEKRGYYNSIWSQLCASFNVIRLFEEAGKQQRELNELNISLESKVESRTRALVIANEKLKEIDRLKTNFFSNISHELRTPLTLILGPVEGIYAGDYGEMINREHSIFRSVINNGSRLLKLINSLLDFSKIEAGKMQVVKQKTDINKLLHYYLSILKSSGKHRGIEVELKSSARDGGAAGDNADNNRAIFAWIDRDLLENALFNLFSNALKFTPPGGKIILELDRQKETFSIAVKDTGIGIPADKLDSIFERFTQVDDGASRKYEGTGIGLAFAREIVGLHEGTIKVESEPGKGTVFTITLPLGSESEEQGGKGGDRGESRDRREGRDRREAGEEMKEQACKVKKYLLSDLEQEVSPEKWEMKEEPGANKRTGFTLSPGNNEKVLIIDDNRQMRAFLSSILSKKYTVITAENGFEGLEKVSYHLPDLIISDVMMSGMDGIEFCRKLKSAEEYRHIPLILLTARTDLSLKIDGLKEMADDFLSKPFNSRELLSRVENLLKVRELHIALGKQQNKVMTSIGYASNIQTSILPRQNELSGVLSDYFILWQPRDIVGGDIYWFRQVGEKVLLAVIDCTGHGIPGAFMTMVVHTELNSVVDFVCYDDPGKILRELNNRIKSTLRQETEEKRQEEEYVSDDGFDICLCIFDREHGKVTYAGARRPLYYVLDNRLMEIEPDKMSLGYRNSGFNYTFTNHKIVLTGREVFYLTSDGYADQLGGKEGFSLGPANLKKLLLSIHHEDMAGQRTVLEEKLKEYREQWKQSDDITILGLKMSPSN